jgi:hypothetical protein
MCVASATLVHFMALMAPGRLPGRELADISKFLLNLRTFQGQSTHPKGGVVFDLLSAYIKGFLKSTHVGASPSVLCNQPCKPPTTHKPTLPVVDILKTVADSGVEGQTAVELSYMLPGLGQLLRGVAPIFIFHLGGTTDPSSFVNNFLFGKLGTGPIAILRFARNSEDSGFDSNWLVNFGPGSARSSNVYKLTFSDLSQSCVGVEGDRQSEVLGAHSDWLGFSVNCCVKNAVLQGVPVAIIGSADTHDMYVHI